MPDPIVRETKMWMDVEAKAVAPAEPAGA